jgi:hypothetical protein
MIIYVIIILILNVIMIMYVIRLLTQLNFNF